MNFLISLLTAKSERSRFWYNVFFAAFFLSGLIVAGKLLLEVII